MTRFKESFVKLSEHDYPYPIKGSGESSYKLDSGKSMTMKEVLFVPRLKKNLLSIFALDAKGMRVAFIDGQVIMCTKGNTINDVVVIGEHEGVLYKLRGHPIQALVHDTIEPNELWHRRLAHAHYRALPLASKAVVSLPEIQAKHDGVCKGCEKGKNTKKTFPSSESKEKGILEIIHSNVCGPMLGMYTMFLSLMNFLGRHGFTS